jgi:hypothetical protein
MASVTYKWIHGDEVVHRHRPTVSSRAVFAANLTFFVSRAAKPWRRDNRPRSICSHIAANDANHITLVPYHLAYVNQGNFWVFTASAPKPTWLRPALILADSDNLITLLLVRRIILFPHRRPTV